MRTIGKKKRIFQTAYRRREFISEERYERLVTIYNLIKTAKDNRVSRADIALAGNVSESVGVRDLYFLEDSGVIKRSGTRWPMKYIIVQDITSLRPNVSCLDEYLGVGEFKEDGSN